MIDSFDKGKYLLISMVADEFSPCVGMFGVFDTSKG